MGLVAPKDPDNPTEYGIDFHDLMVFVAARRSEFEADAVVYYPIDTGWYYKVTTAGKTAAHYPAALPRAAGETLNDGSAVLECQHPSSADIPAVQSVAWDVPDGLTLLSQRHEGRVAYVTLGDGVDGVDYDVRCRVTPTVGNELDRTITIPVRSL
jgi:hypothetical protein